MQIKSTPLAEKTDRFVALNKRVNGVEAAKLTLTPLIILAPAVTVNPLFRENCGTGIHEYMIQSYKCGTN